MKLLAATLLLLGSPAALAQADAGDADAGVVDEADAGEADPCAPVCDDDDILHFCDDGEAVSLNCIGVGVGLPDGGTPGVERCGLVSAAWGFDCLLGEHALCDPDFAGGVSRCDREASLYCIDGTCQVAAGPPPAEEPLEPTAGTISTITDSSSSSDLFGCSGCGGDTSQAFVGGAFLLLLRRRRRG